MNIEAEQTAIQMLIHVTDEGDVLLLHVGIEPYQQGMIAPYQLQAFRLVEVQAAGMDQDEHHGSKHTGTLPGKCLRYEAHTWTEDADSRLLTIVQSGAGVRVRSHLRLYRTIPAIRSFTEVENMSAKPITLTYVSSFALTGLCKEGMLPWDEKAFVWIPSNSWGGEAQWRRNPIRALGMTRVEGISTVKDPQCMQNFSMKRIQWLANGTWGSGEYLPMGSVENAETGEVLTWQIEHHAAWHAEISDTLGQLYLRLSGPTDQENQWAKTLLPHERFCSVPCCITVGQSFSDTISTLTAYRRLIRRDHWDNHTLPVVFNDYMNCLYGDPTTEKLLPLIDAAAHVGCEVFCIDCGWYADGPWWDGVGQWLPSQKRFPNGIEEPISYIRQKGMIPGLWLELEVMGVKCELASVWEDACFFMNHGKRVIDHGRYQLDFRHPKVIAHSDAVIRRLVEEYGIGYIKMDYNINAGVGTTVDSDSAGDGLLQHSRAYLAWLQKTMDRYPKLIIENCSSGGQRMAYSLLSLQSIQSTSDQIDFRKNAAIAAAATTAVTPEQSAVWVYPTMPDDTEAVIFNVVNAILFRIHQSGHLSMLSAEKVAYIAQGIACYKQFRNEIPMGDPFYPTDIPHMEDHFVSYGMHCKDKNMDLIAVWRVGGEQTIFTFDVGQSAHVKCLYPQDCACRMQQNGSKLTIELLPEYCGRLLCVTFD